MHEICSSNLTHCPALVYSVFHTHFVKAVIIKEGTVFKHCWDSWVEIQALVWVKIGIACVATTFSNGDIYLGFVVPLQKSLQQGKAQHFLTRTNTKVDSPIHGLSGSAQSLKHVEILPFNSLKALRFEKTEALNTTTESKRIFVKLNLSIAVQGSLLQRT